MENRMQDDVESSGLDPTGICNWCDGQVGLFKHVGEGVCGRCYGLMNAAGVPHAEIFDRNTTQATAGPDGVTLT